MFSYGMNRILIGIICKEFVRITLIIYGFVKNEKVNNIAYHIIVN